MRGEDDAIAERAVAGYTCLAGKNGIVPHNRGAGQAGLCTKQRVLAHARAMTHLNEIINFGSIANLGCADRGAVDGGIGLYIDAAAEPHRAGLGDLFPASELVFGEAKAV